MGARRNAEDDASAFVHFDWRHGRDLLEPQVGAPGAIGSALGMTRHDRAFRRAVRAHLAGRPAGSEPAGWGWKHPHSYLLLPYLRRHFPGLRFVHVVRDGRDMAFSDNQRQVQRYGPVLVPDAAEDDGPVRSAAFWSAANLYAAAGGAAMGEAYHLMRLEDLCARPAEVTFDLLRFAGALPDGAPAAGPGTIPWAGDIVRTPSSLGRWRGSGYPGLAAVTEAAAPGLRQFGYL